MAKTYGVTVSEFANMTTQEQEQYLKRLEQNKQQTINVFNRGVNQTNYNDLSNTEQQIYDNTTSEPPSL
jgi:hypothetical protein